MINQIRGFLLERGIIVRQGLRFLRQALPDILAKRTDVLSPRMVRIITDLASDWRQLDERIEPGKDVHGELDHRPGIREQPGSLGSTQFAAIVPR